MGIQDAERTLERMSKTVAHNIPAPQQLAEGAKEIFWGPIGAIWLLIGFLLLFGEPLMRIICD